MKILLLRHGKTTWNKDKRMQGHTDIPLSLKGKDQVSRWIIPDVIQSWYVSPLSRTKQTADCLGITQFNISNNLIEMYWGSWEGKTIEEIKKTDIAIFSENEKQGLDFMPDGGESPREVRQRFNSWLASLPRQNFIGAITHKGVIRAALSLAMQWDMKSDPIVKIRDNKGYQFIWDTESLQFDTEVNLLEDEKVI